MAHITFLVGSAAQNKKECPHGLKATCQELVKKLDNSTMI